MDDPVGYLQSLVDMQKNNISLCSYENFQVFDDFRNSYRLHFLVSKQQLLKLNQCSEYEIHGRSIIIAFSHHLIIVIRSYDPLMLPNEYASQNLTVIIKIVTTRRLKDDVTLYIWLSRFHTLPMIRRFFLVNAPTAFDKEKSRN